MNQYEQAAEQMKQSIVEDYLKRNPDVSRSEVVTKLVNGRIVVGTMKEIFKKISNKQNQRSAPDQKLLKKLSEGGDVRYSRCLNSIKFSKNYIQWLSVYKFTGFSDQDQKESLEYLNQQDMICGDKAKELYEAKVKFAEAMQQTRKPTRSLVQTLMLEYLSSTREQLNSQRLIYKKEVELGNKFGASSTNLIQNNFATIRSVKNPKAMRAVEKAIKILKDNAIQVPSITKEADVKLLTKSLDDLDGKLEDRRKEFNDLNALVKFLDTVIEELQPKETTEEAAGDQSWKRMAYTTKRNKR
ncbi:hypothetical protein GF373_09915 [bacterium]|nr:hypothetical protein [bacterium]